MRSGRAAFTSVLLASAALMHSAALAGCTRPIKVPVAASGLSVTVKGGDVGGVFPDTLRRIGARAGCSFAMSVVPRVRIESMFANGQADMLVAATQVERRDQHGVFIPIVETRPALISVATAHAPLRSIDELLARRDLRVALVRGYDYGPAYRTMLASLQAQGRVYLQPDPQTVARMLAGSLADVTIMPAGVFIAGTRGDPRTEALAERLRVEPLAELPWIKSGIYLSRTSLSAADRALLEREIGASVKSGQWWQALLSHYPRNSLTGSTRRIGASPRRP